MITSFAYELGPDQISHPKAVQALIVSIRAVVKHLSSDKKLQSMNSDACVGMGHVFYCLLFIADEIEDHLEVKS